MGKYKAGESGNPGGRPKEYRTVVDLARKRTVRAVKVLTEIMENSAADAGARVKAAATLLDRGWGKAPQVLEVQRTIKPREMSLADIRRRREELISKAGATNDPRWKSH